MSEILQKIEALIVPELEKNQVELVDATYQKSQGGWTLCLYLDKPGGITLDDCEKWSDTIGDMLDQNNTFDHAYSLEVSSPGINRPLKKTKDFQNFIGEKIDVKLFAPLNGQKNFHGILLSANEATIRVREDGRPDAEIPRDQIAKCNLNPEITF